MITTASAAIANFLPATNCTYKFTKSLGIVEIILINNTTEIPLPTPFSVIRSPIYIRKAEPAVNVSTTTAAFTKLYSIRSP
jgi:hypothetical protein